MNCVIIFSMKLRKMSDFDIAQLKFYTSICVYICKVFPVGCMCGLLLFFFLCKTIFKFNKTLCKYGLCFIPRYTCTKAYITYCIFYA